MLKSIFKELSILAAGVFVLVMYLNGSNNNNNDSSSNKDLSNNDSEADSDSEAQNSNEHTYNNDLKKNDINTLSQLEDTKYNHSYCDDLPNNVHQRLLEIRNHRSSSLISIDFSNDQSDKSNNLDFNEHIKSLDHIQPLDSNISSSNRAFFDILKHYYYDTDSNSNLKLKFPAYFDEKNSLDFYKPLVESPLTKFSCSNSAKSRSNDVCTTSAKNNSFFNTLNDDKFSGSELSLSPSYSSLSLAARSSDCAYQNGDFDLNNRALHRSLNRYNPVHMCSCTCSHLSQTSLKYKTECAFSEQNFEHVDENFKSKIFPVCNEFCGDVLCNQANYRVYRLKKLRENNRIPLSLNPNTHKHSQLNHLNN